MPRDRAFRRGAPDGEPVWRLPVPGHALRRRRLPRAAIPERDETHSRTVAVLDVGVNLEIVKRSDQAKGFVTLPKRWIVERTWLGRCRRLAKGGNASTARRSSSCASPQSTKSWDRDALLQPESRAAYQRLLSQGWTDAIRALHPQEPMYTFWDYDRNRWERDGGLRLDHLLLTPALTERLQEAGVDRHARGIEAASDHAPVWVKLRDASRRRSASARHAIGRAATAGPTGLPQSQRSTPPTGERARQRNRAASSVQPTLSDRPLLVIDGDSFAHRSYHALPKTIRRSDGKSAGAVLGFANFLLRLYSNERPRAVIVAWDTLETPTKRHEMFPAYQSGREFAEDLIEQLRTLPQFVAACGFVNAKAAGLEADDFLAAAVASEERAGGSAVVASGDRDSFQLASPSTTILYPSRGGQLTRIGPKEVRQRYGVDPKQVPDFIALRGDPSDKLPGARGVGPIRAAQLGRRYGSLSGVLEAGLFRTQAETLRLYRLIATMDSSAPLASLADQAPTWASASSLALSWGLKQLADRLDGMALPRG
jgi:DNA polymerase I